MYRAGDQGRARSELFRTDAHDQAVRPLRTGNELHRALERGGLCMHYQPIVSLETGRISGFDALLRWQHPQRGLVGPIGSWALEESCRQAEYWPSHGSDVTISVNLSPRQLAEPRAPGCRSAAGHGPERVGSTAHPSLGGPMPTTLTICPWPDAVLDTVGHDPRSLYVETFWLPTLGPT
ncbi:MAG: EAL domain-containing protein, partial [Acidimicrobiia bacterium]|nr:EAL domain-containing protein [Acidimicrobiia bacterium]